MPNNMSNKVGRGVADDVARYTGAPYIVHGVVLLQLWWQGRVFGAPTCEQ